MWISVTSPAVAVLALLSTTLASETAVITLTNAQELEDLINSNAATMVKFYTPWCGHCKALAPIYMEAAETISSMGNATLAEIDCQDADELCRLNDIKGYPTLNLYKPEVKEDGKHKPTSFTGGRDVNSIVSFMTRALLPPVSEVTEDSEAEAFCEQWGSDKNVLILCPQKHKAICEQTAKQETLPDNVAFLSLPDSAAKYLAKSRNATDAYKPSTVFALRQFDNPAEVYTGSLEASKLADWVHSVSAPLVAEITPENYARITGRDGPLVYFFYDDPEQRAKSINTLAEEHRGAIRFVFIDARQYGGHAPNVGLKPEWPACSLVVYKTGNIVGKYPLDTAAATKIASSDMAALESHIAGYLDGSLKPFIKSQKIEEADNKEPVRQIAHSTFEKEVLDIKKDVLIMIYAPWCGHCKALSPTLTEVAEAYAQVPGVMIAKYNYEDNETPLFTQGDSTEPEDHMKIQGFPSLFLFRAETNEMIATPNTLGRTRAALIQFVEEHAVHAGKVDPKLLVDEAAEGAADDTPVEEQAPVTEDEAADDDDESQDEL